MAFRYFPLLTGAAGLALATSMALAQTVPNVFPLTPPSISTVPKNGDVNPYGVAFVPPTVPTDGVLQQGDVLVSNFNNSANAQGMGGTIVRITATGQTSTFYQTSTSNLIGLTGALSILSNGVVIVGSLPTTDGTSATVQAGALTLIDRHGTVLGSMTGAAINGPWGMAVTDPGAGIATVFVSNVLAGTVIRYGIIYDGPTVLETLGPVTIASGLNHRTDPEAIVLGPSGLSYDAVHDILYVASSLDNAVYSIASAGTSTGTAGAIKVVYQDVTHLHGPLDLVMAPNGHLLVANSDGSNVDPNQPSELVEFTTTGTFVAQYSVDAGNGGAFGLSIFNLGYGGIRIGAVDDNANTITLWTAFVP